MSIAIMKKTIFMLRGLPASGKSTECARLLADPALTPITSVSKDEIRKARGIGLGDFSREREVGNVHAGLILAAAARGDNIVIDGMHLGASWVDSYKCLAQGLGYGFNLIDLLGVPVAECIRRDALRPEDKRVGEEIIMKYWRHQIPARRVSRGSAK